MNEIFSELVAEVQRAGKAALCVVVATKGSTPQGHGAKMLVTVGGRTVGTLGGGCVEAEVRRVTLELIASSESRLLTFHLDHDYGWDDGLICGGMMEILVHVITSPAAAMQFGVIATAGAEQRAARIELPYPLSDKKYVEELGPPPVLLIVGAGHVGQSLATMAAAMEFTVDVIDDRADFLTQSRFPSARQRMAGEIEQLLRDYPVDEQTYIVIVTRGHRRDGLALEAVINGPARYVGLIGSKSKVKQILDDLHQHGVPMEKLLSVHSPIGLNIGAVTVPEIAISIAAELVAVRRGQENRPAEPMKIDSEQLQQWINRKTT